MKRETKMFLEQNFRSARRDLSFDKLVQSASSFFEEVDTPLSLGAYLRLKYKAYAEYLSMEINPLDYDNPDVFRLDYQCIKLFSKAEFYPNVFDVKKEAERSFIQSEVLCMETNSSFIHDRKGVLADPAINEIFHLAKRKISRILGPVPSIHDLHLSFGPGNNVGLSKNTSVLDKLRSTPTLTRSLVPMLSPIMASCPAWFCNLSKGEIPSLPMSGAIQIKEVVGSVLGFVPKNAKTHRAICTEPLLNSFVQLGIGKYMRRRLRRFGCNLNSQERNQELARVGSLTNHLATIDLSSASDTISYMTVMELLPFPWFNLLDTTRSRNYTYQGKTFRFEKFSSMGNGFTFELESLLFLTLARSCCEYLKISTQDVSVYGDDIIVPVDAVSLLRTILTVFGFKVNEQKSFSNGPFRESCGKDWFLGHSVRPLFLKRRPTNATLISWCNHIRRIDFDQYDHRYLSLYESLVLLLPWQYQRVKGPDGYGDGHLICDLEELPLIGRCSYRKRGWDGYGYYTLSSSPLHRKSVDQSVYGAALYAAQYADGSISTMNRNSSNLDGIYIHTSRRNTRTVLRRAYHPWQAMTRM